jgi:hypothetical protein
MPKGRVNIEASDARVVDLRSSAVAHNKQCSVSSVHSMNEKQLVTALEKKKIPVYEVKKPAKTKTLGTAKKEGPKPKQKPKPTLSRRDKQLAERQKADPKYKPPKQAAEVDYLTPGDKEYIKKMNL